MALTFQWFPTSCFRISSGSFELYIDPGSLDEAPSLPKADLILVTHHHWDHLRAGTVRQLSKEGTKAFGPHRTIRKLGPLAVEIHPADSLSSGEVGVEVTYAYNDPRPWHMTYHKKGVGVGYVITMDGKRIYHAGDTGLIEEMKHLGPIDIALIPIGGRFTMDPDQALEAVKIIHPKEIIPMHMLSKNPAAFKDRVEKETGSKVRVLARGGTTTFG